MATRTGAKVATKVTGKSSGERSGGARRATSMSDAHKAALAEGREQGQVVRRYLEAVLAQPSRRSRRSPEVVQSRLDAIEAELATAPAIIRLQLLQERLDLVDELDSSGFERIQELEDAFVEVARGYSERKGISYAAWREIGVSAPVLKRSGITARTSIDLG
jgi:hypothetical protein